jgi:hypothetical protein
MKVSILSLKTVISSFFPGKKCIFYSVTKMAKIPKGVVRTGCLRILFKLVFLKKTDFFEHG